MSETPKTPADQISDYLTTGMHHSTKEAKEVINAIIERYRDGSLARERAIEEIKLQGASEGDAMRWLGAVRPKLSG